MKILVFKKRVFSTMDFPVSFELLRVKHSYMLFLKFADFNYLIYFYRNTKRVSIKIEIRPGLIWVQTVCKYFEQAPKVVTSDRGLKARK